MNGTIETSRIGNDKKPLIIMFDEAKSLAAKTAEATRENIRLCDGIHETISNNEAREE